MVDKSIINTFEIKNIVNHLSLFLGKSGHGKSCQMIDCLYKIKDEIPNIIVISPTEDQNHTFRDFVPKKCIYS